MKYSGQEEGLLWDEQKEVSNYLSTLETYANLLGKNICLSVADREKFISVIDYTDRFTMVSPGKPLTPGGAIDTCIKSGRRIQEKVDASRLGVPYIATVVPIKSKTDRVIGAVCLSILTDRQEEIFQNIKTLEKELQEITFSASNLAAAAEQLAAVAQEFMSNTYKVNEEVHTMNKVLDIINEVAQLTHLLGLNAAIEAARAGERGYGFTVVAEEIRKLASKTRSSVEEIAKILKHVYRSLEELSGQTKQISAVTNEQAANIEKITEALTRLEKVAGELTQKAGEVSVSL